MIYPLVRELAAQEAPVRVPVAVTCRVLKIARQPYYRWLAEPVSDRAWAEARLVNALIDAHTNDPEFGHRFLADEVRDAGFTVSDRTVWKRCSEHRVWSVFSKKRGKNGKADTATHEDLVQRQFRADAPDRLWFCDIERHEAFLNLAVVKGYRSVPVAAGV